MPEMDPTAAVFWSYSHQDNELDRGGILDLARKLQNEYALITGVELPLFVDTDLKWGDEWRDRIDSSLSTTAFFVPVLTPRFFTRAECRKEVLAFYAKAEAVDLGELLMPILYATVSDLSKDNADEVVALVSRYQYQDWRHLRLESADSTAVRKAINSLAQRLSEVAAAVAEKQLFREAAIVDGDENARPGILDIADEINALMPDLRDAFESSDIACAQSIAISSVYIKRANRLTANPNAGNGGPIFPAIQRVAKEQLPLAQRALSAANTYYGRLVEIQPLAEQAFTALKASPELFGVLDPFWEILREIEENLDDPSVKDPMPTEMRDFWRKQSNISRLTKQLYYLCEKESTAIDEGNIIASGWIEQRNALTARIGSPDGG